MKKSITNFYKISLPIFALLLASCSSGSDSSSSSPPSSGSSAVGAPTSVIGKTLVQRVTGNDGKTTTIAPPGSVTYTFISASEILGAGLVTIPTTSWSYSRSGSTGTVRLNYSVGKSVEKLIFTSPTSGTYRSDSTLNSGLTGWHTGTFTVATASGGSTGGGSTGGGSTGGGSTSGGTTGKITVYTNKSNTGGYIDVRVDGSGVGRLTQLFSSGSPTCGSTSNGAITRTLSPGSHSVTATAQNGSTWSGTANVVADGCLNFLLRK
jgi:hypothetical protein